MNRSIKAIILKELRENLPWAGVVFLITMIALFVAFYSERLNGTPLLSKTLIVSCTLLFPAAGLSLGLLQIFRDARVGRWQFVSHRPVSPTQWFWCKVAVGTVLYIAPTLIPLAAVGIRAATPGVVPGPFALDMIQPTLALAIAGLLWHSAGLLIAARKARWFGSRIMPVSLPILVMFAAWFFSMTFSQAVLILIGGLAIILLGAWGSFIASDEPSSFPMRSRPSIGIGVIAGWVFVTSMATAAVGAMVEHLAGTDSQGVYHYQMYSLSPDGQLLLVTDPYSDTEQWHDLSGRSVKISRKIGPNHFRTLDQGIVNIRNDIGFENRFVRVRTEGFFEPQAHVTPVGGRGDDLWVYVSSRRTIEGFNGHTRRYIGSIGPSGFSSAGHPAEPFQEPLQEFVNGFPTQLVFPHAVYVLNVADREVKPVLQTGQEDAVSGASTFFVKTDDASFSQGSIYHVIATKKAVHILHEGREVLAVPREPSHGARQFTVGRTADGRFVIAYGLNQTVGFEFEPVSATIYDSKGKVLQHTELPVTPLQTQLDPPSWEEIGVLIPSPPAFFMTVFILHTHSDGIFEWRPVLELIVIATGYAAVGFWMLRARHARPLRLWLWVLLVFLLGLPGLFVLASLLEPATSVRCRFCGKRRLMTERTCPHCGTPAELPAVEGIEILQPTMVS